MKNGLRRFFITSLGFIALASASYFGLQRLMKINRENATMESAFHRSVLRNNDLGNYSLSGLAGEINSSMYEKEILQSHKYSQRSNVGCSDC
jgi:hypothetical protein